MDPNVQLLELAVSRLGALRDELVFVGGCTTSLLITESGAPEARPTTDVDAIVEVSTRGSYETIADKLRAAGFGEDSSEGAPICRWTDGTIFLDVMPTDSSALGFTNEWYLPALQNAVSMKLPSGTIINVITAPYFLATKLVAFNSRGNGDFVGSHDLEDVMAVVDGRPEIIEEVSGAQEDIWSYLSTEFGKLLENPDFLNVLPGLVAQDTTSPDRFEIVRDRLRQICS